MIRNCAIFNSSIIRIQFNLTNTKRSSSTNKGNESKQEVIIDVWGQHPTIGHFQDPVFDNRDRNEQKNLDSIRFDSVDFEFGSVRFDLVFKTSHSVRFGSTHSIFGSVRFDSTQLIYNRKSRFLLFRSAHCRCLQE